MSWLTPQDQLDREEVSRGMRWLLLDGVSSQVMGALTGGALLVAFALLLGASNTVIGLIAAVGPLTQVLQLPAIFLVERTRRRKALVLLSNLLGRSFWFLIAAIPWLGLGDPLPLLLVSLAVYFGCNSIANSAYNSWKRDLVPDSVMGRYFATRLTLATGAAAAVTLASGFFVDRGAGWLGDVRSVYSILFVLGGVSGILGVAFLGRIPEPRMKHPTGGNLFHILAEPLREHNFRQLLVFLATWNFAINLAAPFFSVYLLRRLGMPLTAVLGLSVLSQIANLGFFRIWGGLADRISNKAVLGLAGTLFVLSIALWPFTTLPERYFLTWPLLIAIHGLAGISTAGVNLCAGSITLKLAPRGKAAAYLATNAWMSGLAATLAPLVAGPLADFFAEKRLSMDLSWSSGSSVLRHLTALDLSGLDFLFVISVLAGLYSLHRLLAVVEAGSADNVPVGELYDEVRKAVRHVSNVAGLRRLSHFPYAFLRTSKLADQPPDGPNEQD